GAPARALRSGRLRQVHAHRRQLDRAGPRPEPSRRDPRGAAARLTGHAAAAATGGGRTVRPPFFLPGGTRLVPGGTRFDLDQHAAARAGVEWHHGSATREEETWSRISSYRLPARPVTRAPSRRRSRWPAAGAPGSPRSSW